MLNSHGSQHPEQNARRFRLIQLLLRHVAGVLFFYSTDFLPFLHTYFYHHEALGRGGGGSLTMIFSDGFGLRFDIFYAAAMVVAPCPST